MLIISNLYILKTTNKLKTIFGQIPDFRRSHKQLYDLESILVIGIISVICGADSWNEMENKTMHNPKKNFCVHS